jgi:signal transduction histidine kinase
MRIRTSSRVILLGLFLILLLIVLNASALLTYHQVRGTIEEELGERLLGVAAATAAGIAPGRIAALQTDPQGAAREALRQRFARVLFDTGIGDLYVFDVDRRHLLGASDRYEPGYENPALELHYAAATAALAGVPAASELYRVGGVYLKTAFSPIFDEEGAVIAVLAAEGGASFFQGLWRLRRQVLVTGAAGMIVVIALAVLFSRLLRAQAIAERTLRETSALAAAGELAAILAHEIRNPLTIISARAERVQAKLAQGQPPEEILTWFETIPREIGRLDSVLTQYLAFARPADLQGDADLAATIEAALTLMRSDLERRGLEIERDVSAAQPLQVAMAPAALHQILVNLLLNARDATPAGGRITIRARHRGNAILLEVADTGCGMSRDEQARAFDSFYTTKPQGSGLGLALVRSVAELYAARLELDSAPGEGTRFSIWLPPATRPAAGGRTLAGEA